jgi:hypothetical protein
VKFRCALLVRSQLAYRILRSGGAGVFYAQFREVGHEAGLSELMEVLCRILMQLWSSPQPLLDTHVSSKIILDSAF